MAKRKSTKGQTSIYKTLNRKLKNEQHELHQNPGVNTRKYLCGKGIDFAVVYEFSIRL